MSITLLPINPHPISSDKNSLTHMVDDLICDEEFLTKTPNAWEQLYYNHSTLLNCFNLIVAAERWAKLMQVKMSNGELLSEEMVEKSQFEADNINAAPIQKKVMASVLVAHWECGAKLGKALNMPEDEITQEREDALILEGMIRAKQH